MLADCLTLYLPDQIFNTLYCQPYNSYNVSSENVVLNQLIIPWLIIFFIHMTCLLDIAFILWGEILSWSFMGVKGLIQVGQQITCVMFVHNIWLNSLKEKHNLQWVEDIWTQVLTFLCKDKHRQKFSWIILWISFRFIWVDQLWVILQYRLKTVETDCWDYVKGDLQDHLLEVITW